jgi:poly(3-hydroxyalkanoate) synthetase
MGTRIAANGYNWRKYIPATREVWIVKKEDEPEMVWMYAEDWAQHEANQKEVKKLLQDDRSREAGDTTAVHMGEV